MGRYSFDQLKQIWIDNGGNTQYASIAAAVALAESGGNSSSISPTNSNGTNDQGLWQISRHGIDPSLQDPNLNARIAIQMSNNGTNWGPWSTAYNDGRGGGGRYGGPKNPQYFGPSSPFWKYLRGTGAAVPTGSAYPNTLASTSTQTGNDDDCLWKLGIGPVKGCIINRSQGRAVGGVLLMTAGGLIATVGVILLVTAKNPEFVGAIGRML